MAATKTLIDFSKSTLNHCSGFYVTILDDVFSPEECRALVSSAVASESWKPAALAAGEDTQTVHIGFRNSERIVYIDGEAAERIYQRLLPHVETEIGEIVVGGEWEGITGKKGRKQGSVWKLTR